ncbi:MAG: cation transporter [Flavobacteriales bacterium]|nr:cation transporter [Flavobacteriales bacterium]
MSTRSDIRLQAIVVLAGVLLMAIKFFAWRATHSNAILSDALESIVNVVAGCFALYALILAAKPSDREHPYGHGKIEFISAGVEGGLVVIAGAVIIGRAVMAWIAGHTVHEIETGIVLTASAGGLNLIMGLALQRRGRSQRSITMEASGTHLLGDAWSTLAMLLGLAMIHFTGLQWFDSLFAIGFGLFITVQGILVVRRAVAGIMDETDMDAASGVVELLEQHRRPQWVDVHNFRVIQFGRTLHIDCHVTLPWYFTLERSHAEIADIEALVNEQGDRRVELFIHMDPCIPSSCTICGLKDCPERRSEQQQQIPWDLESVLGNAKHGSTPRGPEGAGGDRSSATREH